jgi:3-phenylpropionate/trans-cinnamate dioxygenase ferredoxin reductase component
MIVGNDPTGRIQRVVVVGGSLAGVAAAEELRQRGFGGDVALVGDEALLPYDRPPLSKAVLAGEREVTETLLRPSEWYDEQQIDLTLGDAAVDLDVGGRTVGLASGARVPFEGLVIATGAAPIALPGAPPLDGVHTLRTAADAEAIRERLATARNVVIVGGGFIGAEVAATAAGHDCTVTILEALGAPMERVIGTTVAELCADLHRGHGVAVRTGALVTRLHGESAVRAVALDDGTNLDADLVIIGIGVRPSVGWLSNSGLAIADGVLCDSCCRTGAGGIVAAGDVARWEHPTLGSVRIEHWENASRQGQSAARALLGEPEPYGPVPYVWSDQYDRKIQIVGDPSEADEMTLVDGSYEELRFVALYGRAGRLVGALAMNRSRPLRAARSLLADGVSFADATEAFNSTEVKSASRRPGPTGVQ